MKIHKNDIPDWDFDCKNEQKLRLCPEPKPEPEPKPKPKPEKYSILDVCTNILASVALNEAALAHILNAEGEKIQKIIEITCCPCEIIKANLSVKDTIVEVTKLERILVEKIKEVRRIMHIHGVEPKDVYFVSRTLDMDSDVDQWD